MNIPKALIVFLIAMISSVGGLMILTNPKQNDYEAYATKALADYLKYEVCPQVSFSLGGALTSYCKTMVDTGRPQIRYIIAQTTVRENYLFFSIYETELLLPATFPGYQFGTIGAFQQFYIYEAEQL